MGIKWLKCHISKMPLYSQRSELHQTVNSQQLAVEEFSSTVHKVLIERDYVIIK